MEIGISTFVETTPADGTGPTISHAERIRQVVEEIVLADKVALEVFGVGEHHRIDYAASTRLHPIHYRREVEDEDHVPTCFS